MEIQMRFIAILFASLLIDGLGLAQISNDPPADPFACSATKPCKIGCCGKNNVCGLGPNYCSAANCTSSCGAKSDCDPGWGGEWSAHESCPLNVCCSQYGFCGTTKEFCGTKTVKAPSCSGNSASQKIIGYYEGWSTTRSCGGLYPEDLLVGAYTHLYYSFAFIDPNSYAVAPMADNDKDLYPRFTGLKQYNPGLETWISIGGWSFNDPDQPTKNVFSTLAGSTAAQNSFFKSLINFMSTYGFDGVDIDWEYPVAPERSGNDQDFSNYVSFLKNLRAALGSAGHKYGLSITLPSSYWYMQHFDIKSIEPVVDWFQVMTYDLHGTWDSTDPYIGAIVNAHTNLTEIDQTLDLLWRNQIDPAKVNMGIGFYGRSFTLSDPSCSTAGCPFSAGGKPGPCTASAGTLSYSEINDIVAAGAKTTVDKTAGVAIVTWDNDQWVSYDNDVTLKQKMDYANSKCLGGVLIWAASTDDAKGSAIQALNGAAGRKGFSEAALRRAPSKENTGQCVWGECATGCPAGLSPVTASGGKSSGYAGIYNGCDKGKSRYYCCPTGNVPDSCTWRGTAPLCGAAGGAKCKDNEVEVTSATSGPGKSCLTGHKNFCCSRNSADQNVGKCVWSGSAPICTAAAPFFRFASASCPSDHSDKLTTGKYGNGGEQPCWYNGGYKSYCCSDPVPYKNCKWYQGTGSWISWANAVLPVFGTKCKGECPAGQIPLATDPSNCNGGTYSYFCCDNPNAPQLPAPGDVAVCDPSQTPVGSNPAADPDEKSTSGGFFDEAEELLGGDCALYDSSSSGKRSIYTPEAGFIWNDTLFAIDVLESRSVLAERGTRDVKNALKLCLNGAQVNRIYPQTYPGAQNLIKNVGRTVYAAGKPVSCAAFTLAKYATKPADQSIVSEHVFEKQQFRDILQRMMEGTVRGGGKLKAGALRVQGVFDSDGIFFKNWPNVNSLPTRFQPYGSVISDTFMGVLGRTADRGASSTANFDNLQVLSRPINGVKALIVAGKAFSSTKTWTSLGPLQQLSELSQVLGVFDYLNEAAVQQSYSTTYQAIYSLMGNFGQVLSQNGISYDLQGATRDIVNADLTMIPLNSRALFNSLINTALEYWNSDAALFNHGKVIRDAAISTLNLYKSGLTTRITLDAAKLTGS